MKTLKRTLALALALVLMVGLMSVAAAAKKLDDFSDADTVDAAYKTATEAMIGLGVIEGDERGIRPTDTITRGEAAKIICFILVGAEAAEFEALPGNTNYSDVPADEWYAMYITYCTEKGIVSGDNGDGTGTFRPEDKINGYEFAKMCLCAVGYDSNYEGFESAIWNVEIKSLATKTGSNIAAGLKAGYVWSDSITRQEAFQMAFNAMKIGKPIYASVNPATGAILADATIGNASTAILAHDYNTELVSGPIKYQPATATAAAYYYIDAANDVIVSDVNFELIGITASVYAQNKGTSYAALTSTGYTTKAAATFTDGSNVAALLDKTNAAKKFCGYELNATATLNINGITYTLKGVGDYSAWDAGNNLLDGEAYIDGATNTIKLDATGTSIVIGAGNYVVLACTTAPYNTVDYIYVETYAIGKVGAAGVTTAPTTGAVTVAGLTGITGITASKITGYKDLKANDIVMTYSFLGGEQIELYKLDGTALNLNKFSVTVPTFGSSAYTYSAVHAGLTPNATNLGTTYNVYFDDYGNIAYVGAYSTGAVTTSEYYGLLVAYQANGYRAAADGASNPFGGTTGATTEIKAVEQAVIYDYAAGEYKTFDFNCTTDASTGNTTFVAVTGSYFMFDKDSTKINNCSDDNTPTTVAGNDPFSAYAGGYQSDAGVAKPYAYHAEGNTAYANAASYYVVKYKVAAETGKITEISIVDVTKSSETEIVKGAVLELATGTTYATSAYKYIYRANGNTNAALASYTGYANSPTLNSANTSSVKLFYSATDKIVVAAYAPRATSAATKVVYIPDNTNYEVESYTTPGNYVVSMNAYVDGERTKVKFLGASTTPAAQIIAAGFYTLTESSVAGYYTTTVAATDVSTFNKTVSTAEATFIVANTLGLKYVNANTVYYIVNTTSKTVTVDATPFSKLSGANPSTYTIVYAEGDGSNANTPYTSVYYTIAP